MIISNIHMQTVINDLQCFGSLENMIMVTPMSDKTAFEFRKRGICFNVDTRVICKITTKETKQGGINYSFILTYTCNSSNKVRQIKSGKYWTITSLLNGIIETQKQIIP